MASNKITQTNGNGNGNGTVTIEGVLQARSANGGLKVDGKWYNLSRFADFDSTVLDQLQKGHTVRLTVSAEKWVKDIELVGQATDQERANGHRDQERAADRERQIARAVALQCAIRLAGPRAELRAADVATVLKAAQAFEAWLLREADEA